MIVGMAQVSAVVIDTRPEPAALIEIAGAVKVSDPVSVTYVI